MRGAAARDVTLGRILVALDARSESEPAVGVLADLARRFGAELVGLFVEDADLLRVAASPAARAVGEWPAGPRAIDPASMERALRVRAAMARRMLLAAAERRRVRWSFQVARGRVAREVSAVAASADLVGVCRRAVPLRAGGPLGSTARALVEAVLRPVLVLSHDEAPRGPVVVLFEGGVEVVALARRLAEGLGEAEVTLLCPAEWLVAARTLETQAAGAAVEVRVQAVDAGGVAVLARAARTSRAGLLVLDAAGAHVQALGAVALIEAFYGPVMVMRGKQR